MTSSPSESSLGDKTSRIITFYKDLSHEVDGHFSRALSTSSTSSSSSTVVNCNNTNENNSSDSSLINSKNSPSNEIKKETIESSGIGDFSSPTPPSANNPERKSDAEPHYDDISQQHHASTPPPSSTPAIIYPGLAGLLVHPLIDSFSDAPRIQGQPVTYNRSGGTSHPPPPPPPPLPPSYLDYTPAQEMQSGALNMSQAHFHYNGNFREFSFVSPQATKQISYYHHHNHQHPPSFGSYSAEGYSSASWSDATVPSSNDYVAHPQNSFPLSHFDVPYNLQAASFPQSQSHACNSLGMWGSYNQTGGHHQAQYMQGSGEGYEDHQQQQHHQGLSYHYHHHHNNINPPPHYFDNNNCPNPGPTSAEYDHQLQATNQWGYPAAPEEKIRALPTPPPLDSDLHHMLKLEI